MSNVVQLHKPPPRIAHYIRVGHREHVLADRMHTERRISQLGLVFDACYVASQKDLIRDLRSDGRELILDTKAAEQSVPGLFSGTVSDVPWGARTPHWRGVTSLLAPIEAFLNRLLVSLS